MRTHEITRIALATAILSVAVYMIPPIQLSFLPVPFTLQLMMVLFISLILSPKEVVITISVYLFLGAIGLPIFSGARGGLAILLGPTGGFLWMFLPLGYLISFYRQTHSGVLQIAIFQSIIVFLIFYPIAIGWLSWQVGSTWLVSFLGMLPFMVLDGLKIIFATLLYKHTPISIRTTKSII